MDRCELRKWLLDNSFTGNGRRIYSQWTKKYLDIYTCLKKYTAYFPDNVSVSARVRAFLNGQIELNKCIVCGKEVIPARSPNQELYCSHKCSIRSDIRQNRVKNTCLEKYGCESNLQHDTIKEQIRETCLKKYGVENPKQSKQVKQKSKETCLKKYGVDNPAKVEKYKEKYKETCLRRYGTEHPMQNEYIENKCTQTSLKKYGKKRASMLPEMIQKHKNTCLEKYGVEYISQRHIDIDNIKKLEDRDWLHDKIVIKKIPILVLAEKLGVSKFCLNSRARSFGIPPMYTVSGEEMIVYNWLNELGINVQKTNRSVIGPKELDIYLPEHNLAIEYNGVYWHTELRGKDKKYHLSKTLLCEEQDIQLLHIFSSDDLDIWKSVILSKLGRVKKIGARQTKVVHLSSKEANQFSVKNHLQGPVNASLRLGLVYKGTLVSVMTFGKPRFNKKYQWELLRFCSKKGYQVMGAASKLLKHSGVKNCISYANRRWSRGNLYESIGFEKIGESTPNYFYTTNGTELYSRNQFQKHKLSTKLDKFDPDLTEYQNMLNNGYDRIWDCGNLVYEFKGE